MIARVIYGLAEQGNLPKFLTKLNPVTRTPLAATIFGALAILLLSLAVPLAGLADLTSRCTLVIFAVVNLALVRIKLIESAPPLNAYVCPLWVPIAGLISTILFLGADIFVR